MFASPIFLVMLTEDHLLAAGGMLGHVDVRVTKVVVIAASGLVSLMVERAFLVFHDMARGAGGERQVALVVGAVDVVLLHHLPGQRVVVGQRRRVPWVVLRRSVLWKYCKF